MKALFILKTIVFLLTALLFAGFGFMFTKLADKQAQSKLKNEISVSAMAYETISEQALSETESIVSMSACNTFVCLLTEGNKSGPRLFVIQPESGKLQRIVNLQKTDAVPAVSNMNTTPTNTNN